MLWKLFILTFMSFRELENCALASRPGSTTRWEPPVLLPLEVMARPLELRFKYHFSGDRSTNRLDKVCVIYHATFILYGAGPNSGSPNTFYPTLSTSSAHIAIFLLYISSRYSTDELKLSTTISVGHMLMQCHPSLPLFFRWPAKRCALFFPE